MKCPSCQHESQADANFCHLCGWMIRPYCIPCRLELPADARFCSRCGLPLLQVSPASFSAGGAIDQRTVTAPIPKAKPDSNLNRVISENISDSLKQKFQKAKEAIEGERKLVTVLFADISGFTAMSETMDPEQVTDIINVCFKRLGATVYKYEGYIDKFIGDCVMALFGAPIAHENDPELALLCAMEMLEELRRYNSEKGLDLGITIGVNSGMVVAGGVGTNEKFDYTVMGDAVNLAQRLQSAAKRNQILVSKAVYRSCERIFDFHAMNPVQVKGKRDKIELFELLAKKKNPLRERGLQAGYGKLVGRKKEVEIAERLLEEVKHGTRHILCVSGDAGVGKSRLKHEIKKSALRDKLQCFEGRCSNLNNHSSYFVFMDILRKIFNIEEGDSSADRAAKLKTGEGLGIDLTALSFLEELLLDKPTPKASDVDASQKKNVIFLTIKKLFSAVTNQNPSVFFFDDLHWIDPLSKELLGYLMENVAHSSMMIYCAFRPEFRHDWHENRNYTQLSLTALSRDESIELVNNLLDLDEIPSSLQNLIETKTEGNPLYVEEIIKTLIESEKIVRQGDRWHVSETLDQFEMPQTLQGLIATRIDKLDEMSKKILQYASVIGKQFFDRLIAEASKISDDLLYDGLKGLRKRELIFEIGSEGDRIEYIFNHTLTQEVAYSTILTKKRKIYHERVAEAIERLYHDQISNHLQSLALHYSEAGNRAKAIEYLHRSAEKMAFDFNNKGALQNFEKALALLQEEGDPTDLSTPTSRDRLNLYVSLLFEAADVYRLIGKYDDTASLYQTALKAVEPAANPALEANCYLRMGDLERLRGHIDAARDLLTRALEKATQANHFEYIVKIHKSLGNVETITHNSGQALEYFTKGLNGARSLNNPLLISEYLNDMGTIYIQKNEIDKAETALAESREIADKSNQKSVLIRSLINLGVVRYYKSDLKGALEMFTESATTAEKIGDMRNWLLSKHNIGDVLLQFGRHEEALKYFEESYRLASELKGDIDKLKNLIFIGYLKTKLGQITNGEKTLAESIIIAETQKYWEYYCVAHHYFGLFLKEHQRLDEAKSHFEAALKKATEVGYHSMADGCKHEISVLDHMIETERKKITA